jgi:esterase
MMPPILNHTRVVAPDRTPEKWLLVLHGIYGSGRNWGTIARQLVQERPEWGALLVDLRMHGGSKGFTAPHTLAAAAADVDALVEHLDFHAAAVLGHSFGGKVALVYTQHHADDLRQSWVVDSTLEVREPSGSAWRMIEAVRALPSEFESRAEAVSGLEEHGYASAIAQWMAMNLEHHDGLYRWRLDLDGVEEMLRDYFRTDVWETVESPPAGLEVHIVKATESSAIGEAAAKRVEAAHARHGRTHLHRVEGGHWLNTDNPEAVLRLLVEGLV